MAAYGHLIVDEYHHLSAHSFEQVARQGVADRLAAIPREDGRVILATGKHVGEGFDDLRLDTLFLTLPVSWRGTIAQYAGRRSASRGSGRVPSRPST